MKQNDIPFDAEGTWLISFADLITLLLCTFLMFFSITWNKTTPHGIQLAKKVESAKSSTEVLPDETVLRFQGGEIDRSTGTITPESLKRFLDTKDRYGETLKSIEVEGCGDFVSEQNLWSQLIDAGTAETKLSVGLNVDTCELLHLADTAGGISVRFLKRVYG